MTKISFWNQRRYSRGQKPMPEFSIGKHDQQEFPCSLETRVWGNDLIKNAKLAKLAQLQNRSLEAANPPSKNDSLNTNRTNYPNLYDLLSIISHRPLSLRSKAEGQFGQQSKLKNYVFFYCAVTYCWKFPEIETKRQRDRNRDRETET